MRTRLLAAAALAAAAVTTGTGAAHAAPCVGTDRTLVLCFYPPGVNPTGSSWDDCVHVGVGDCVPVSVPIPTIEDRESRIVSCHGDYARTVCDPGH